MIIFIVNYFQFLSLSDSVASHMHTHKSHTHRQYNEQFMIRAPDRYLHLHFYFYLFHMHFFVFLSASFSYLEGTYFCICGYICIPPTGRVQPTRSAQQKNKSPPVEAPAGGGGSPQKLTLPPAPEAASTSSPCSSSSPILPPWRQWLSHDDMHLVRKQCISCHIESKKKGTGGDPRPSPRVTLSPFFTFFYIRAPLTVVFFRVKANMLDIFFFVFVVALC